MEKIDMASGYQGVRQRKPHKMDLKLNLTDVANDSDSADDNKTPEYPLREDHPFAILNKERLQVFNLNKLRCTATQFPLPNHTSVVEVEGIAGGEKTEKHEKDICLTHERFNFGANARLFNSDPRFETCSNVNSTQHRLSSITVNKDIASENGDCCDPMRTQALNLMSTTLNTIGNSTTLGDNRYTSEKHPPHSVVSASNEETDSSNWKTTLCRERCKEGESSLGIGSAILNLTTDTNNNAQGRDCLRRLDRVPPREDQCLLTAIDKIKIPDATSPRIRNADVDPDKIGDDECNKSPPFLQRVDQSDMRVDSLLRSSDQTHPPTLSPINSNNKSESSCSPSEFNLKNTPSVEMCPIINDVSHLNSCNNGDYSHKVEHDIPTSGFSRGKLIFGDANYDVRYIETTRRKENSDDIVSSAALSSDKEILIDSKDGGDTVGLRHVTEISDYVTPFESPSPNEQNESPNKENKEEYPHVENVVPIIVTEETKRYDNNSTIEYSSQTDSQEPLEISNEREINKSSSETPVMVVNQTGKDQSVKIFHTDVLSHDKNSELKSSNDRSSHTSVYFDSKASVSQVIDSDLSNGVNVTLDTVDPHNQSPLEDSICTPEPTVNDVCGESFGFDCRTTFLECKADDSELNKVVMVQNQSYNTENINVKVTLEDEVRSSTSRCDILNLDKVKTEETTIDPISDCKKEDIKYEVSHLMDDNVILTINMPHDVATRQDQKVSNVVDESIIIKTEDQCSVNSSNAIDIPTNMDSLADVEHDSSLIELSESSGCDDSSVIETYTPSTSNEMSTTSLSPQTLRDTLCPPQYLAPVDLEEHNAPSQISLSTTLTLARKPNPVRCYPYSPIKFRGKSSRRKRNEKRTLKALISKNKSNNRSPRYLSYVNSVRTPIVSSKLEQSHLSSTQSTVQPLSEEYSVPTSQSNHITPTIEHNSATLLIESPPSTSIDHASSHKPPLWYSTPLSETPPMTSNPVSTVPEDTSSKPDSQLEGLTSKTFPCSVGTSQQTTLHSLSANLPVTKKSPSSASIPKRIHKTDTHSSQTIPEATDSSISTSSQSQYLDLRRNEMCSETSSAGYFNSIGEPVAPTFYVTVASPTRNSISNSNRLSPNSSISDNLQMTRTDLVCNGKNQAPKHSPTSNGMELCFSSDDRTIIQRNVSVFNMASSPTPSEDDELASFMSNCFRPRQNNSSSTQETEPIAPSTGIATIRKNELCALEALANEENDVPKETPDSETPEAVVKCESPAFLNEQHLISVDEEDDNAIKSKSPIPPDITTRSSVELPLKDFFTTQPDRKAYSSLAQAVKQFKSQITSRTNRDSDDEDVLKFLSKKDTNAPSSPEPSGDNITFYNLANGEMIDLTCDGNEEILSVSSSDDEETESADSDGEMYSSPRVVDHEIKASNEVIDDNSTDFVEIIDVDKDEKTIIVESYIKSDTLPCNLTTEIKTLDESNEWQSTTGENTDKDSSSASCASRLTSQDTVKSLAEHIKRRALKMSLEKKAEVSAKIHSIIVEKSDLLPESLRTSDILPEYCSASSQCEHPEKSNSPVNETENIGNVCVSPVNETENIGNAFVSQSAAELPIMNDIPESPKIVPNSDNTEVPTASVVLIPNVPFATKLDNNELSMYSPRTNANIEHEHTPLGNSRASHQNPIPNTSLPTCARSERVVVRPFYTTSDVNKNEFALNLSTKQLPENYRTVWCSQFVGDNVSTSDSKNTKLIEPDQSKIQGRHNHDPLFQKLELLRAAKVINPSATNATKMTECTTNTSENGVAGVRAQMKYSNPTSKHPQNNIHSKEISNLEPVDLSLRTKDQTQTSKQTIVTIPDNALNMTVTSKSCAVTSGHQTLREQEQRISNYIPVMMHRSDEQAILPLHHTIGLNQHRNSKPEASHGTHFEQLLTQPQHTAKRHVFPHPTTSHSQQLGVNSIPSNHTQIDWSKRQDNNNSEYTKLQREQASLRIPEKHRDTNVENRQKPESNMKITHVDPSAIARLQHYIMRKGAAMRGLVKPGSIKQANVSDNEYSHVSAANDIHKAPYTVPTHLQQTPTHELRNPCTLVPCAPVNQQQQQRETASTGSNFAQGYQNHGNKISFFPHPTQPPKTFQNSSNPQFHQNNVLRLPTGKDRGNPVPLVHFNGNSFSHHPSNNFNTSTIHSGTPFLPQLIPVIPSNTPVSLAHHKHSVPSGQYSTPRAVPLFIGGPHGHIRFQPMIHKVPNPNVTHSNINPGMIPQNNYQYNTVRPAPLHSHLNSGNNMPQEQEYIIRNGIAFKKATIFALSNVQGLTPNNIPQHVMVTPLDKTNYYNEDIPPVNQKKRKRQSNSGRPKKMKVDLDRSPSETKNLIIDEAVDTDSPCNSINVHLQETATSSPVETTIHGIPAEVRVSESTSEIRPPDAHHEKGSDTPGYAEGIRDLNISRNIVNLNARVRATDTTTHGGIASSLHPQIPLNDECVANSLDAGGVPAAVESRSDSGFSDSVTATDQIPSASLDMEYVVEEYEENGMQFVSFKPLEDEEDTENTSAKTDLDKPADVKDILLPAEIQETGAVLKINENIVPIQVDTSFSRGLSSLILASQKIEASEEKHSLYSGHNLSSSTLYTNGNNFSSPDSNVNHGVTDSAFHANEPVNKNNRSDRSKFDGDNPMEYLHKKAKAVRFKHVITDDEKQVADLLVSMVSMRSKT